MGTDIVLKVAGRPNEIELSGTRSSLIVAGFTSSDAAAVEHHIAELVAIGVPRPAEVPAFYPLDSGLLCLGGDALTAPASSSGEAEPILIRDEGSWYLGVGSDHTDREVERSSIQDSKAACVKPIGDTVLAFPEGVPDGAADAVWPTYELRCWVDEELYQQGGIGLLRPPSDLLARLEASSARAYASAQTLVVFCGTLPLLRGSFVLGREWRAELRCGDDVLELTYAIKNATGQDAS